MAEDRDDREDMIGNFSTSREFLHIGISDSSEAMRTLRDCYYSPIDM
jgi:hypothetical protein